MSLNLLVVQAADKGEGNVAVRQGLSFVTVLSLMYVMVRIMLYFKNMQHHATEIYGEDSYYRYYPTVLYSVLPAVATIVFEPIAEALNKFEGHTTKVSYIIYLFFFVPRVLFYVIKNNVLLLFIY